MAVNQVIVGDEVKLDLTADTVSEDNLLAGATAHNAAGEPITGAVVVAPIDSELSETSENPVQNKAIMAVLNHKADKKVATPESDGLMSAADKAKLDGTGGSTTPFVISSSAPSDTSLFWINDGVLKYYNGSAWVACLAALS